MSNDHGNIARYLAHPVRRLPRAIVLSTLTLLLASAGVALLVKMDTVVTIVGRIAPAGKVKSVQAVETGEIRDVRVKEDQFVERGQLITLLDTQISSAELKKLERLKEKYLCALERLQASLEGYPPHSPLGTTNQRVQKWTCGQRPNAA